MRGIEDWIFDDAVLADDGRYQVNGRYRHARTYYGDLDTSGVGFDWHGMLIGPVTGYGDTAQAARDAAAYAAGLVDGRNNEIMRRANYQIMGAL